MSAAETVAWGAIIPIVSRDALGPWSARAACAHVEPDLFFPERGESTANAKAVCVACPVREACLDYAIRAGEKFGIWGGTSERERRSIRRRRARGTRGGTS